MNILRTGWIQSEAPSVPMQADWLLVADTVILLKQVYRLHGESVHFVLDFYKMPKTNTKTLPAHLLFAGQYNRRQKQKPINKRFNVDVMDYQERLLVRRLTASLFRHRSWLVSTLFLLQIIDQNGKFVFTQTTVGQSQTP